MKKKTYAPESRQQGDAERIHQLIHEDGVDPNMRDSQNITPLHWAACVPVAIQRSTERRVECSVFPLFRINNRLLACKELLLSGAEVDAVGGELQASPLQWAAR